MNDCQKIFAINEHVREENSLEQILQKLARAEADIDHGRAFTHEEVVEIFQQKFLTNRINQDGER